MKKTEFVISPQLFYKKQKKSFVPIWQKLKKDPKIEFPKTKKFEEKKSHSQSKARGRNLLLSSRGSTLNKDTLKEIDNRTKSRARIVCFTSLSSEKTIYNTTHHHGLTTQRTSRNSWADEFSKKSTPKLLTEPSQYNNEKSKKIEELLTSLQSKITKTNLVFPKLIKKSKKYKKLYEESFEKCKMMTKENEKLKKIIKLKENEIKNREIIENENRIELDNDNNARTARLEEELKEIKQIFLQKGIYFEKQMKIYQEEMKEKDLLIIDLQNQIKRLEKVVADNKNK